MGFFKDLFNFSANPLSSIGGGGGGGGFDFANPMSMFGGGSGGGMGGMSNPMSMFSGGSGGGSGFDVGGIGGFGGTGGMPGVTGGGAIAGQGRPGQTGSPTYPTMYGNAGSAYPLAFLGALTGSEAVYGRKPDYPLAPTPDEILRANLYANQANQPAAQDFAGRTNQFNLDQLTGLFEQTTPGMYQARDEAFDNVLSRIRGEIPQSAIDKHQRQAAAWGLQSGTGRFGEPGNQPSNKGLRNYGRDVMDTQRQAEQDLQSLIAETRRDLLPPLSDPAQFTLQPRYDPYAEDQRLIDIAKVLAAPVPSAAGAAAAQQALIEGLLAWYSGSPKSGSTDPSNYYVNWDTGNSEGAGSGEPGNSRNSSYIPYSSGGGGGGLGALAGLFG